MHSTEYRFPSRRSGREDLRVRFFSLRTQRGGRGKLIWGVRAAMRLYPHDCRECQNDKALQESWGCLVDSAHEIDRRPCSSCSKGCDRCHQTGFLSLRRCPIKTIPNRINEVIRYSSLAKSGLWPEAGGSLDQAQSFLDAHTVIQNEITRIEEESHG